jgi:threonine/homoserine/homoserine lactone efflux protein
MFARGRRRGACQAAGIAVEVMIAMVLLSDGLARMVM